MGREAGGRAQRSPEGAAAFSGPCALMGPESERVLP